MTTEARAGDRWIQIDAEEAIGWPAPRYIRLANQMEITIQAITDTGPGYVLAQQTLNITHRWEHW